MKKRNSSFYQKNAIYKKSTDISEVQKCKFPKNRMLLVKNHFLAEVTLKELIRASYKFPLSLSWLQKNFIYERVLLEVDFTST